MSSMMGKWKIFSFFAMVFLISSTGLVTGQITNTDFPAENPNMSNIIIQQNDGYGPLQDQITTTSMIQDDRVIDGKNLFGLRRSDVAGSGFTHSDVLVTDMNGNIEHSLSRDGTNRYDDPEMINSTTVFLRDDKPLFWNLKTGEIEYFNFSSGGHDMEYNPITDTFLLKVWKDVDYGNETVRYNDLYEKDRDGNTLWFWNSTEHFPYDPLLADGEYQRGRLVWMHANSVFWDFENGKIYLGSRGLDTFYQIDRETGNVDWGLGRLGDFTLFDDKGNEVDSLFYHPHAVEKIQDNRFILYDNDYLNITSEDPYAGLSSMLEIEVDVDSMEAKEVWRWTAPADYFGAPWGDADKLPGGNNLGTFGHTSHDVHLTEVNQDGEVVWEMNITQSDEYLWGMYRAERFYEEPLARNIISNTTHITLDVYDTVKLRHHREASLRLFDSQNQTLYSEIFQFKPHFQGTEINIDISQFDTLEFYLSLTNDDNITLLKEITIPSNSDESEGSYEGITGIFSLMTLMVILRRKRSGNYS